MNKNKKKVSFIDSKYTASFIGYFSGVALLGFILCGLTLFLLLDRRLGLGYLRDISTLGNLQDKLPLILLVTGIIQATILSLILSMVSLFWAHAVSGPMVRLSNCLKKVKKAEFTDDIAFRKNDQLHYLAKVFTRMQASLKNRKDKYAAYLTQASQIIKDYEHLLKSQNAAVSQLKNKLFELKSVYQRMGEFLGRVHL